MKNIKFILIVLLVISTKANLFAQKPQINLQYYANSNCNEVYFRDSSLQFFSRYSIVFYTIKFNNGDTFDLFNNAVLKRYTNGNYSFNYIVKVFDSLNNSYYNDTLKGSFSIDCGGATRCKNTAFIMLIDDSVCRNKTVWLETYLGYYGYSYINLNIDFGDNTYYNTTGFHSNNIKKSYTNDGNWDVVFRLTYYDTINKKVCYDSIMKNTSTKCDLCSLKPSFTVEKDNDSFNYLKIKIKDNYSSDVSVMYYFGDSYSSSQKSPNHTYQNHGVYSIHSKIWYYDSINAVSCIDSIEKSVFIDSNTCFNKANLVLDYDSTMPYFATIYNYSTGRVNKHRWEFGDGNSSTLSNPTHTYSNPGTFYLVYWAYDTTVNCYDSTVLILQIDSFGNIKRNGKSFSIKVIDRTQNISSISQINRLKTNVLIYPNPTQQFLTIKFPDEVQDINFLEIIDPMGKKVFENYSMPITNQSLLLDLDHLSNGYYIIKIPELGYCQKLIIQK